MRKPEKNLHVFSLRLKKARAGKYTQEQLAEISGVSLKTIQRLEAIEEGENKSPLACNLIPLAQALDVTSEYLLLGEDDMRIYMEKLKDELKGLTNDQVKKYHDKELNDKVLAHLKLTESFVTAIQSCWAKNHAVRYYRSYVKETILKYCQNRGEEK